MQLIHDYYAAFNAKNVEAMLALLTDDVVHDTNQGERSSGKSVFVEFMAEMNRFYDENLVDIVVMTNIDQTRAAAEFICNGKYLSTAPGLPEAKGQTYSLPVGCFFEIKGGKIARVTNYYNMTDWLKQVR